MFPLHNGKPIATRPNQSKTKKSHFTIADSLHCGNRLRHGVNIKSDGRSADWLAAVGDHSTTDLSGFRLKREVLDLGQRTQPNPGGSGLVTVEFDPDRINGVRFKFGQLITTTRRLALIG